ncbi:uncharacterized protein LOC129745894 [Uranotaenia lowii]|uniref:uncharacterized protein LOC129745894 n=1 Tax=Uranotaenia lowii TaxID=190385 RepID=UPI002478C1C9|nr:uncharacterized protein LOC129745894 [Uranotaenia lowii]
MSFDQLPEEILQKIFDYLPHAEHIDKTRVSRRWNRLALKETYLILAYGESVISERILQRTSRGYCCFSIEFSESYEALRAKLALCAKKFFLRKLILDGIQTYAIMTFVDEHRLWLRSLVHLSITSINQINTFGDDVELELPRLRILSWTFNTDSGNRQMPVFRIRAPLLEDVYIEHGDLDRTPLILENTSRLKSLGLFVPRLIEGLCPNGLESATCLRVYNSSSPFEWNIDRFNLPRLQTLELCGCSVNSNSTLFLRNFRNLEMLVIQTETSNVIDLTVVAHSLPKLRILRLFEIKVRSSETSITFPSLQTMDLNDTICSDMPTINARNLMTLKGTSLNVNSFILTDYSVVRCLILYDLYLNFRQPRQFSSLMILYLDVPCDDANPMLAECLLQFPRLFRLTIVLHNKRAPINISGHFLAMAFVDLNYLHMRNFDLDYNFLEGINKARRLMTLILQDGTLAVSTDDRQFAFNEVQYFYMKNVMLPKQVINFPILYPTGAQRGLSLAEGNVFSTETWDDLNIKSQEDYVTYLVH